jgi:hypothetical protein
MITLPTTPPGAAGRDGAGLNARVPIRDYVRNARAAGYLVAQVRLHLYLVPLQ